MGETIVVRLSMAAMALGLGAYGFAPIRDKVAGLLGSIGSVVSQLP